MKGRLLFAAKVLVAAVLVTWLVKSGALDFGKLDVVWERPPVLFMTFVMFAASVCINGTRWRLLLRLAGVEIPLLRAWQLHLTAMFFNLVIPGNVGGDVIKSLYVARDTGDPAKRTPIFLAVFADRLLGLAGLVTTATVITVARGPALWNDPLLRPMAATVALLGAGVLLGPALLVVAIQRGGARVEKWLEGPSRIARLLTQILAALRLLTSRPLGLAKALGLAMTYHAVGIAFFTVLTHAVTGQDAPYSAIATVFPLGLLTIMIPIAPSGVGVGHAAFDGLFKLIGLTGGANVFNVFLICNMAPCLLGVFPYLTLRRTGIPSASDAAS